MIFPWDAGSADIVLRVTFPFEQPSSHHHFVSPLQPFFLFSHFSFWTTVDWGPASGSRAMASVLKGSLESVGLDEELEGNIALDPKRNNLAVVDPV